MEETLKRLKETHNERDFTAIVESMRRKIRKGTLDYNLYLFESTLNKLDDNRPDSIDKSGAAALSGEKVEEPQPETKELGQEKQEKGLQPEPPEDYEPDVSKPGLVDAIKKLKEMTEFCEECCRNFDQEIILSQLEEESKELLEGFKYE